MAFHAATTAGFSIPDEVAFVGIDIVVNLCGYESDGFAKKFFRQRTGMSMREYRKCACNPISGGVNATSSSPASSHAALSPFASRP